MTSWILVNIGLGYGLLVELMFIVLSIRPIWIWCSEIILKVYNLSPKKKLTMAIFIQVSIFTGSLGPIFTRQETLTMVTSQEICMRCFAVCVLSKSLLSVSHYNDVIMNKMAFRLFTQPFVQAQIKENIKVRVTDLCAVNSPVTGEFPAQRASNTENVSIWWRHHAPVSLHWH